MATVSPSRPPVFNLPNQLTAARFVLALVLFLFIALHSWLACVIIFILAAITDYLDGYLARRQGLTSTLGRNLDPLVDKVLTCGAYIFLLPISQVIVIDPGAATETTHVVSLTGLAPWMVTVVVSRELVITGLRSFMENQGATFGADWLGKVKMGLQCAALIAIFICLHAQGYDYSGGTLWFLGIARDALIYGMLGATTLSGLQYLWRAALLLKVDADA